MAVFVDQMHIHVCSKLPLQFVIDRTHTLNHKTNRMPAKLHGSKKKLLVITIALPQKAQSVQYASN